MPKIAQSGEKGSRKKTSNQWFETQDNIAYWSEFYRQKIVYSEIVQSPQFYLDKNNFFAEATSFVLTGENLEFFVGILHSKLLTFAFKNFYAGGGLGESVYRYKKAFLELLPIPKPSEKNQDIIDEIIPLTNKIFKIKEENPQADISNLDSEIDQLVYKLYDLNADEIDLIEEKIKFNQS